MDRAEYIDRIIAIAGDEYESKSDFIELAKQSNEQLRNTLDSAEEYQQKNNPVIGKKYARKCDITGLGMNEGWYDEDGRKISYIKNEADVIPYIKGIIKEDEQFKDELPNITNDRVLDIAFNFYNIYWTEWEDESEYEFIINKEGKLVEIES